MKVVNTNKAPKAIGPYSQAIEANGLIITSGQLPIVFLSDMNDFAAMNEVYAEFFSEPFPARSAIAVKTLPKNALVEVECIAAK